MNITVYVEHFGGKHLRTDLSHVKPNYMEKHHYKFMPLRSGYDDETEEKLYEERESC